MHYSSFNPTRIFSLNSIKKEKTQIEENNNETVSKNVTGFKKDRILFYSKLFIFQALLECYSNPRDWFKGVRYLFDLRKGFLGNSKIKKIVRVQNEYYSSLFAPPINDKRFKTFIKSELHRFKKVKGKTNRFSHVFLAITTKCPLQCDHCYEWDRLNKKETLDEDKLKLIIEKLQKKGVSQIHFTGGEPLLKFDMILHLLKIAGNQTDFWLNTSGYQLTYKKAKKLKDSGLKGIFISLDHHDKKEHNQFRNYKDSYFWATEAANNAVKSGLVVTLSVCVRKEFVNEENLMKYMVLAKTLGVSFVQFLEPKAVGHYKTSDVALKNDQIVMLESFFEKYNFSDDFLDFPLICYHDYYHRRIGCLNNKDRGLYIDSNGGINPCPFCHTNTGNILEDDFDLSLQILRENACPQLTFTED